MTHEYFHFSIVLVSFMFKHC